MNLVPGSSVVELCPAYPDRVARYFTEVLVGETCTVPPAKPDKEKVVNLRPTVELVDVETVTVTLPTTPATVGNKVFVGGRVWLDVQYISTRPDQSVHFFRCQLPFEAIILQDCGALIPTTDPIFGPRTSYVVHVCLEKLTETQIDPRTIRFEALLLVWVELVPAQP